jgi:hypothetical protein
MTDDTDANQKLVAHLAEAPGNIQPLMTSLATKCRPELHEGNLFVTVPFEDIKEAMTKARRLSRIDLYVSLTILVTAMVLFRVLT